MILPNNPGLFGRPIEVRPGLDIQGGLRVLLEADPGVTVDRDAMERARTIIEQRVNGLGVAEPVIQVSGANRIVVELPGVRNPEQAKSLIKQTGLLEFVDFSKSGSCTAPLPVEGQYIYTDVQARLRPAATGTPTPTVLPSLTITAVTPTLGVTATLAPTLAATTASVQASNTPLPPTGTPAAPTNTALPATNTALPATNTAVPATNTALPPTNTAVPPTATETPAASVTPVAFSDDRNMMARPAYQATVAATPAAPTAAATVAATATQGTPPPTPTATATVFARDGVSKERGLLNPCTGQPFTTVMSGDGLQDAVGRLGGSTGTQWVIGFTIKDNEEGRKFGPFTARSINQQMAITLDGQVLSAPVIQARLDQGGEITGNFTQQTAQSLALQLRYGALPVPLREVSTEEVGASLGADSVEATARAGVIGVLMVLIYMIITYRIPGVMAALALLLFSAINFALFKYVPITLTLPALTGFLISIGTAVDGSILVFERIKEEVRGGRTLEKAIDIGFDRAWPSIRDSNISTLMIGFVLFFLGGQFGASAVRGFALTLMLGLVINLFTAVVVTRTLLDVVLYLFGDRIKNNKSLLGL
jgi:protein-export membrane protein SecD